MNKGALKSPPHGLGDSVERNFQTNVTSGTGAVMGPKLSDRFGRKNKLPGSLVELSGGGWQWCILCHLRSSLEF